MTQWTKDPEAVLDYQFDWSSWLAEGETITSHVITATTGITVDSSSQANGLVTVWLSGGTAGDTYTIECLIVTDQGRTDERSKRVVAKER